MTKSEVYLPLLSRTCPALRELNAKRHAVCRPGDTGVITPNTLTPNT